MSHLVAILERVGFPVIVALYFMFRMEVVLDRVVQVLIELQLAIQAIS